MIYGGEGNGGVGLQLIDVIGDGLIEFIAIGCLDNIVHATDVFCWEDANEIAGVANWLYLIEQSEWTDHGIGRPKMLPLHEGAYLPVVPIPIGQHRVDAKDRHAHGNQTIQRTPQSASACHRHDRKQ